jgi:hypothetical protein
MSASPQSAHHTGRQRTLSPLRSGPRAGSHLVRVTHLASRLSRSSDLDLLVAGVGVHD